MPAGPRLALSAAAGSLLAVAALAAESGGAPVAVSWSPGPGGWSGIDVSADGARFVAVSDRGLAARGRLVRDGGLAVAEVEIAPLLARTGRPPRDTGRDAEGVAWTDRGLAVSYEAWHRVWLHPERGGAAKPFARLVATERFRFNHGLEALAVDAAGRLHALPELPQDGAFPVHVLERGRWRIAHHLPADPDWQAVGADFGPDGAFYLLERTYWGLGFASRIRRARLARPRPAAPVIWRSLPGRYGNLEGIGIWADAAGRTRAVMVSDDNGLAMQRGRIVEVTLGAGLAPGAGDG